MPQKDSNSVFRGGALHCSTGDNYDNNLRLEMTFDLNFPSNNPETSQLKLGLGEVLFVLGANGTGKSGLMQKFLQQNQGSSKKISAHRQTWMYTDTLDMTPANKVQTEQTLKSQDLLPHSRYKDDYASQRTSITIYELIDAENVRARKIAEAFDNEDINRAIEAAKAESPLAIINDLIQQSNIPIRITIHENDRLMASKDGGGKYGVAQLSDGERNALLIAGDVLTAPEGTLIIIDEPERHLHRSIISPLLSRLFEQRRDCSFVISTHDYNLPLENPHARILLLRSCSFSGQDAQSWEADELKTDAEIDDVLKKDLLGARRKILFVEGTDDSLDKSLYSLIFPMVSVIPKGNCREVERAVVGVRECERLHWLQVWGIADGDGWDEQHLEAKREKGIYLVPYYSVEAIYFHPEIIKLIAGRQASNLGDSSEKFNQSAIDAGLDAIRDHTERLSKNVTKKVNRQRIMEQIPNDDDLLKGDPVNIQNESAKILEERKNELDTAVNEKKWLKIIEKTPIRSSQAPNNISTALKFRTDEDYQKAVRTLLSEDTNAVTFVRDLFGDLANQILDQP